MSQPSENGHFSDLGISKELLAVLEKKGFTTPTPIQHQVIPVAQKGDDVIGIAQTGTGKTLAFAIPMIEQLIKKDRQGLIIVPTRELAEQVEAELLSIGRPLGLKTAVLIGGSGEHQQIRALKKRPHIVIATPGRLMDFVERKILILEKIAIVTLDEADRMLDMGFLPSIERVMKKVPNTRQTFLFSATMPKSIGTLARKFMRTPVRIEIAPQGSTAENIEQEVCIVQHHDKIRLLEVLLSEYKNDTILIFSRTKHGAKRMVRRIRNMGHSVTEMHGNKSQTQRRRALEGFNKRKFRIMVATDVAARGIDVDHIGLVINYDLPDSLEDYVHRIGRTGRAGRHGKAISFATRNQKKDIRGIERIIKASLAVLELPPLPEKRKDDDADTDNSYQSRNKRGKSNNYRGKKSNSSNNRKRSSYSRNSTKNK